MRIAVYGMRVASGKVAERFYTVVVAASGVAAVQKAAEIHKKDGWSIYDVEIKTLDT